MPSTRPPRLGEWHADGSPAARFVTGQVITVDGGSSADQLKVGLGEV